MSVFSLMEGEHLGGFILRRQYFSGKIISNKFMQNITVMGRGAWRLFPFTSEEFKDPMILKNHTLEDLFRPTSKLCFFKSYDTHSALHTLDFVSTETGYCPLCVEEQIREYGFFWFRREWLTYKADSCVKHSCELSYMSCRKCNYGLKFELLTILQGRCIRCQTTVKLEKPVFISKIPPMTLWSEKILKENFPRFSKRLLENLLRKAYELKTGNPPLNNKILSSYIHSLCTIRRPFFQHECHPSEVFNGMNKPESIEKFLNSDEKFCAAPFLMFWWFMIFGFEDFSNFNNYLNSVSVLKKYEYYDRDIFPYLDLT